MKLFCINKKTNLFKLIAQKQPYSFKYDKGLGVLWYSSGSPGAFNKFYSIENPTEEMKIEIENHFLKLLANSKVECDVILDGNVWEVVITSTSAWNSGANLRMLHPPRKAHQDKLRDTQHLRTSKTDSEIKLAIEYHSERHIAIAQAYCEYLKVSRTNYLCSGLKDLFRTLRNLLNLFQY